MRTEGQLRKQLVIMDDDPEIAEQIRAILAPLYDVVAVTDDARTLLRFAESHRPDAALLDISMPGISGFALAGLLRNSAPAIKIIFVTQHSARDYVDAAQRAGASGYVWKRKMSDDLAPAVQAVLSGGQYTSPALPS
jgi:DNA-binding NarL/FixJ family response regulator